MRALLLLALVLAPNLSAQDKTLRVGLFPNVTHAQPLVARAMAREGKPWFEPHLGPGWKVEWFTYNAGPGAMEAFFAKSIDLTYVGPNPAINAHVRSAGQEVRIIAGSANGGAALIIPGNSPIKVPADFRGKRIATPQLGNTQDVAARAWLAANGLKTTPTGAGDAQVVPTANPDQLSLFQQGKLDGVWTVEPWVSRLEREAGGKIFLEQKEEATTVLAVRRQFLTEQRDLVKRFAAAHAELTEWINANAVEARRLIKSELKELTKADMNDALLESALGRLTFTATPPREALGKFAEDAKKAGFLKGDANLTKLVELP